MGASGRARALFVCNSLGGGGAERFVATALARLDRSRIEPALCLFRRDLAYGVRLCTRAVDRLFEASGAHALFDASSIQRGFRDLHAMAAHPFVNWDTTAELFGRTDLGLPPKVGIV